MNQDYQKSYLRIGETASQLGVSIDTLRRWDKAGKLKPSIAIKSGHRYYSQADLKKYLDGLGIEKMASKWAKSGSHLVPPETLYCQTIADFSARLPKLEQALQQQPDLVELFSLITAAVSEIGNNSFDHNIGNWPDLPGIFFGYTIRANNRIVVLADRGQGILKTLKRTKQDLKNDQEALTVAFTKIISGRSPENRGNGLKYVRKIIIANNFQLIFQTGQAILNLRGGDKELAISTSQLAIPGCLAIIKF
jgi:DNA-binding transcriptional MerR regulator